MKWYHRTIWNFLLVLAFLPEIFCASAHGGAATFPKRLTAGQEAIAGATAGFAARIAVAPIDLVKIRLQLQRNHIGEFSGLSSSRPKYSGMWQTMRSCTWTDFQATQPVDLSRE